MTETVYTREGLSPPEYYASLGGDRTSLDGSLKDKFHDIDNNIHFHEYLRRLELPATRNFVLDFGNEDAWCATDLRRDELTLLLSRPVCRSVSTRGDVYEGLRSSASKMLRYPVDVSYDSALEAH